jgi:hypothetical protein
VGDAARRNSTALYSSLTEKDHGDHEGQIRLSGKVRYVLTISFKERALMELDC